MKTCEACGTQTKTGIVIGGSLICRRCEPDIKAEIERLREAGKPVHAGHIARKIFRETHSAGNYLLRDIPKKLWTSAKHRAVDENISLRDLVLNAIRAYL